MLNTCQLEHDPVHYPTRDLPAMKARPVKSRESQSSLYINDQPSSDLNPGQHATKRLCGVIRNTRCFKEKSLFRIINNFVKVNSYRKSYTS